MLVLAAALILSFVALRALPGDPVAVMLSDHSADTVDLAAKLRAEYGLDQSARRRSSRRYVTDLLHRPLSASRSASSTPPSPSVLRDSLLISPVLALAALTGCPRPPACRGQSTAARSTATARRIPRIILVLVAGLSIPNFAVATFLVYCRQRAD